ncbi:LysR substrate-binding domain-containing protein [Burkholderia gladioli]|uniref:LysR substrate-binding domain-containing protein n=1 Tax=Burkholderia gladioli TaxID=28095 RepID=UPI00202E4834|nr:LysR substrate-binding domain-containing protein [Burkholderia gladioli]URV29069.1 LysR substrate-binding domain-containing protein [Burkholderia gladioli]
MREIQRTDVLAGLELSVSGHRPAGHPPISPRLQVSSPDAAVDAAIRGLGFTQLPHYHVAEAVDAGKLEIVLDSFELDPVPIQLVHVSRNMMPLKLRRFLDFATPRFRESLSRFARQT